MNEHGPFRARGGAVVPLVMIFVGIVIMPAAGLHPVMGQEPGKSTAKAATADAKGAAGAGAGAADDEESLLGDKGARVPPITVKPYRILAYVAFDPAVRLDLRGRAEALREWRLLVERFVGAPWELTIAPDEGPLGGVQRLEALPEKNLSAIAPAPKGAKVTEARLFGGSRAANDAKAKASAKPSAKDAASAADAGKSAEAPATPDKLWMFRITSAPGGLRISSREFDVTTQRLGATFHRDVLHPLDVPRELLDLAVGMFAPLAEIGPQAGGGVTILIQGSMLSPTSPLGEVAKVGAIFRPIRTYYKPDGTVLQLTDVLWSYLLVDKVDGPNAVCKIFSAYRDPLTKRVARRNKIHALGVKPSDQSTRIRFVSAPDKLPMSGYRVLARPAVEGSARPVALSDRQGEVILSPAVVSGLVKLQLLAGDIEPLAEFPFVPGESAEAPTVVVDPKPEAMELHARVNAINDEIVNIVAQRARYLTLIKSRAAGNQWDEVARFLGEIDKLPKTPTLLQQVLSLREKASATQKTQRKVILTRAAASRLAELESLLARYLDDEPVNVFRDELEQKGGRPRVVPTATPPPAGAGAAAAAPATTPATPPPADAAPGTAAPPSAPASAPAPAPDAGKAANPPGYPGNPGTSP